MTKKKLTQNPLFLPLVCVVLVLAVNVVYDIAQGNAFYDFFRITMQASAASHTGEQRFIYCGMFPDRERSGPPAEGCEIPHGEGANHRVGGCEKSHGEGEIFRSAYKGRKTKKLFR